MFISSSLKSFDGRPRANQRVVVIAVKIAVMTPISCRVFCNIASNVAK